jgi:hypothetical protein
VVKSYLSYLLRLWPAGTGGGIAWRASLEDVSTGERQAFADLDALLDYLREQTQATPPQEQQDGGDGALPGPRTGGVAPDRDSDQAPPIERHGATEERGW